MTKGPWRFSHSQPCLRENLLSSLSVRLFISNGLLFLFYLELLSPVALGAIPLNYGFPQIQQEYISIVKAVP